MRLLDALKTIMLIAIGLSLGYILASVFIPLIYYFFITLVFG